MPTYDFECTHCGHRFSEMVAYSKRSEVPCPECGKADAKIRLTGFFVGKSSPKSPCGPGGCSLPSPSGCPGAGCGCPGAM
ncbi:FmdB family zinc ribbon protein [Heliobacterium mobile]|uniref:FmdB family zinc ribbon protein n=1 Tax=Heliobacterium mobile TaxID=28064 RepID=UPI0012D7CFBE|nr:zinc ribbon domain-containing protein [Heliobacterium mobile]